MTTKARRTRPSRPAAAGSADRGQAAASLLGRRLLALLVDWLLAVAISMGFFAYDSLATLLVFWTMTTLLVGTLGFTIGHRVAGVRVSALEGGPLGLVRAAVRTTGLCLVVPAVVWGPDGRALHDRWAGTSVVTFR